MPDVTRTAETRGLISTQPRLKAGSGQASSLQSCNHEGVSDPTPNVDASPRRPRRHGCAALLLAGFALALVLLGGAAAYWRHPHPGPPNCNAGTPHPDAHCDRRSHGYTDNALRHIGAAYVHASGPHGHAGTAYGNGCPTDGNT